jgi:hypothetical protein
MKQAVAAAEAANGEQNPNVQIAWIAQHYDFSEDFKQTLILAGLRVLLLSPDQVAAWIDTCPFRSSCFPEWGMAPAA